MKRKRSLSRSHCWLAALLCASLLLAHAAVAQQPCPPTLASASPDLSSPPCISPLTAEVRLKDYARSTFGPGALALTAVAAGIAQARNHPSAWEQGMEGYSRRYASRLAQRAISGTFRLGVEALLDQDSRYYPSLREGAWGRAKSAIADSFLARDRNGTKVVPAGRIVGAIGAGLLSRTWQPEGHDGVDDGFRSAGISVGFHVGANVFREFWPDIRKHLPFF